MKIFDKDIDMGEFIISDNFLKSAMYGFLRDYYGKKSGEDFTELYENKGGQVTDEEEVGANE